jgi:predicted GIY-YIG superfamily endonuclease
MYYVYLIKSLSSPGKTYIGYATSMKQCLKEHNAGNFPETAKFKPWEVVNSIAFVDEAKAIAFEKYIKTDDGKAFARKKVL